MPQVKMPDGQVVEMPDQLTPELAARLKALQAAPAQPAQPEQPAKTDTPGYIPMGDIKNHSFMDNMKSMERPLDIAGSADQLGAGTTDLATKLGAPVPLAAGLGTAANVGVQALPMLFGGAAAGDAAAPVMRSAAEGLMKSALKPTLQATKKGLADTAVKTMLDDGIPLSQKGMDAIKENVSNLNDLVKSAIADSKATVKISDINKAFSESMSKYKGMPKSDLDAIKKEWDMFRTHPMVDGKAEISVQDAQILKQGFQKSVSEKFGQEGSGTQEAQKAIARGLRVQVGEQVPEVIQWNAKEKKLLDTLTVAQRRVIMEGNKNPLGLAAAAVTHPIEFTSMMADRSAAFKAFVARILNKGQTAIPATAAGAGIAATTTAMSERARRKQERAANAGSNN